MAGLMGTALRAENAVLSGIGTQAVESYTVQSPVERGEATETSVGAHTKREAPAVRSEQESGVRKRPDSTNVQPSASSGYWALPCRLGQSAGEGTDEARITHLCDKQRELGGRTSGVSQCEPLVLAGSGCGVLKARLAARFPKADKMSATRLADTVLPLSSTNYRW
ncbi:hypothetical protein BD413DRAFT_541096 [Trametes elegans]|nr:hypothetical protein BD413DRAFT_541096 [Trametes elegans]